MVWPPYGLDTNLIAHALDMVGRALASRREDINNIEDVAMAVIEEWASILQRKRKNLIRSRRSRCDAVITAHG